MADTTTAPTAPASLPNYLAEGLPKQEMATLEDVREYVDELIEYHERPVAVDELPDDAEPVDDDTDRKGTLVTERVKCSADCTCNDGRGHGPYVYRYYRTDGTLTSEYIGKP